VGKEGMIRKTICIAATGLFLASCAPERAKPIVGVPKPVTAPAYFGPVVDETGQCSEAITFDSTAFKGKPDDALIGLNECQIVAIHGEPPLSVMSGASQNSRRETTILYMEPNGKAVYLFSDNRLKQVVR
jgi:hypothetical protein